VLVVDGGAAELVSLETNFGVVGGKIGKVENEHGSIGFNAYRVVVQGLCCVRHGV
jgi:hypothetical protein